MGRLVDLSRLAITLTRRSLQFPQPFLDLACALLLRSGPSWYRGTTAGMARKVAWRRASQPLLTNNGDQSMEVFPILCKLQHGTTKRRPPGGLAVSRINVSVGAAALQSCGAIDEPRAAGRGIEDMG